MPPIILINPIKTNTMTQRFPRNISSIGSSYFSAKRKTSVKNLDEYALEEKLSRACPQRYKLAFNTVYVDTKEHSPSARAIIRR